MLSRKEILENFAEPSVSSVICALVFVCVYPNSVYIQMNILIPRINADSLLCKYACKNRIGFWGWYFVIR